MRPRIGKPCACGCGKTCGSIRNTWASPQCVPRASRQANGRKARQNYALVRRAQQYKAELDRLLHGGRRLNREELLATFQAIYDRGYSSGLIRGLRRTRSEAKAA